MSPGVETPEGKDTSNQKAVISNQDYTKSEVNRSATLAPVGKAGEPPKGLGTGGYKPLMRNRSGQDVPPANGIGANSILSGEVVSRKVSDHRSGSRPLGRERVKSGISSLVGFFSRLLQAHLLGPARLLFGFGRRRAGSDEPASASPILPGSTNAPVREAGALFCPVCFWCVVEQQGRLPAGIVTLSDCPRHRSTEGRAKVHGL